MIDAVLVALARTCVRAPVRTGVPAGVWAHAPLLGGACAPVHTGARTCAALAANQSI